MSRNHHRNSNFIFRVFCTDDYHRDEPGFSDLGYHLIGTLSYVPLNSQARATPGYRWYGPREKLDMATGQDPELSDAWTALQELPLPVKLWRDEDDNFVWRFRCTCGRDPQHSDAYMGGIVQRWMTAFPESTSMMLDITRL